MVLSLAVAADKDGGRTGVGGGFFKPSKAKTLMQNVWSVFTDARKRGELEILPAESTARVQALLDSKGDSSLKIEIREAVYVKTNIADRSSKLVTREDYALWLVDQNPAIRVRELPAFVYRNPDSENHRLTLVLSESVWENLDSSQRIAFIFSQSARLAGLGSKVAKELSNEFMAWLKKNPEIEQELATNVE